MENASLGHTLKQHKPGHRHKKSSSDCQDFLHRRRQSATDMDMDIARRKAAAWAWYQRGNVEINPTRSTPVVMVACRRKTSAVASRFKAEAMVKENAPWNCGSSLIYDSLELQWFVQHLDGALEGQVMERDHARSFSMPHDCSDNPLKQVKAIDEDSEEGKHRLKGGKDMNRSLKDPLEKGRVMDPLKEGKLMDVSLEERLCFVNRRPRSRFMSDYSAVMSNALEKSDEAASPAAAAGGIVKCKRSKLPWPLRFITKSFERISRIQKDGRVYHHLHHHYHYLHDQTV